MEKKREKKERKRLSLTKRTTLWDTYIGTDFGRILCPYCGVNKISQLSFEAGHVISRKDGGDIDIENLRPLCNSCNKSLGSKLLNIEKWNEGIKKSYNRNIEGDLFNMIKELRKKVELLEEIVKEKLIPPSFDILESAQLLANNYSKIELV